MFSCVFGTLRSAAMFSCVCVRARVRMPQKRLDICQECHTGAHGPGHSWENIACQVSGRRRWCTTELPSAAAAPRGRLLRAKSKCRIKHRRTHHEHIEKQQKNEKYEWETSCGAAATWWQGDGKGEDGITLPQTGLEKCKRGTGSEWRLSTNIQLHVTNPSVQHTSLWLQTKRVGEEGDKFYSLDSAQRQVL